MMGDRQMILLDIDIKFPLNETDSGLHTNTFLNISATLHI